MSMRTLEQDNHILHLLIDRATEGLDSERCRELDVFLEANPIVDGDALDLAAASVDLAWDEGAHEPLPVALRDQILAQAGGYFATAQATDALASKNRQGAEKTPLDQRSSWGGRAPWFLAAASILLAAVGWWQAMGWSSIEPDLKNQYSSFVAKTPDLIRASWTGNVDELRDVNGDVVWSDQTQCGFMRLKGLPPNEPNRMQYQLWIVDPTRDKNPVDGGVFDVVNRSGEVIVPIEAKLHVHRPAVFALTREKPGGVVVSAGPLAVVASVSG